VLPRTDRQREQLERRGGLIVPPGAIDAQSLIAYADLVVSAGGTMNREAVALGTPVWTTFEGRLGAVDAGLIDARRLRKLTSAEQVQLVKRTGTASERVRRDPRVIVAMLFAALPGDGYTPV
jgi:predicted glycosyltransferase